MSINPEQARPQPEQPETRGVVTDVVVPVVGAVSTGVATAVTAHVLAGRKPPPKK
jgi:hypothetical protein